MSTSVTSAGRDAAAADWVSCPGCRSLVYGPRLGRLLGVCPECGWHRPVGAGQRLDQLLDPGSRRAVDVVTRSDDPLGFVDDRPYPDRLAAARAATGLDEGAVCARGTVDGNPVVVVAMDFRFMGGSLGRAVGEIVTVAAETALTERTPLLIVTASGGARMQEGALALMQMAKTAQAIGQLDDAGILSVALVTDPTYGGVAASFATVCDVILAEPGARLGFAGRRVVEQTIRQQLPAGFQTAEFLLEHGIVDAVVPRSRLRAVLAPLLSIGARREGPAPAGVPAVRGAIVRDADTLRDGDAWDLVRAARDLGRPTTTDYLAAAFDEFLELRGDRMAADSRAVVGGLARIDGVPVVVIGQQKGHDAAALRATNYGMSGPEGYRKAARLMRLAAKLGLPVVTLVDTPGAYPGIEAEEHGQAVAIAESIRLMSGLPVPVVTVVTGEGGSGGALALGVANEVLVLAGAVYSVITPEGCAAILWKDPAAAPAAAAALGLSPARLLRHGVVDGVVPEPAGGAGADPAGAAERLRGALLDALTPLLRLDAAELVARRRARFRAFGAVSTRSLTPEGRADR